MIGNCWSVHSIAIATGFCRLQTGCGSASFTRMRTITTFSSTTTRSVVSIDFGDMAHSHVVNELAITLAYCPARYQTT